MLPSAREARRTASHGTPWRASLCMAIALGAVAPALAEADVDATPGGRLSWDVVGEALDEERIRAAVLQLAEAALGAGNEVTLVSVRPPVVVPGSAAPSHVTLELPRRGLRAGLVSFPFEMRSAEGRVRRSAVRAELRVRGPLVVASREIARGGRIERRDIGVEIRDWPAGDGLLQRPESAIGRASRRTIAAGAPIRSNAIKDVPAVVRHQRVLAHYRKGSVALTLDTVAKKDGVIGAIVPIRGIDAHRSVAARVIAPGQVEILTKGRRVPAEEGRAR